VCNGGVLSPEERVAHEKHVLERAVGVSLDAELVRAVRKFLAMEFEGTPSGIILRSLDF